MMYDSLLDVVQLLYVVLLSLLPLRRVSHVSGTVWTPYGTAHTFKQGCSGTPYQGTTLNRGAFIVAYTLDGTPIGGVPGCTGHGIGELVRTERSLAWR